MAQVVHTENGLANLERAFEFPAEHDSGAAVDAARAIREAVGILSDHPLVGRRVEGEVRLLVISYGGRTMLLGIASCPIGIRCKSWRSKTNENWASPADHSVAVAAGALLGKRYRIWYGFANATNEREII